MVVIVTEVPYIEPGTAKYHFWMYIAIFLSTGALESLKYTNSLWLAEWPRSLIDREEEKFQALTVQHKTILLAL